MNDREQIRALQNMLTFSTFTIVICIFSVIAIGPLILRENGTLVSAVAIWFGWPMFFVVGLWAGRKIWGK